ncbi:hypothetical protein BH11PLA1_BH11PLA1_03050 [soil metagenome]
MNCCNHVTVTSAFESARTAHLAAQRASARAFALRTIASAGLSAAILIALAGCTSHGAQTASTTPRGEYARTLAAEAARKNFDATAYTEDANVNPASGGVPARNGFQRGTPFSAFAAADAERGVPASASVAAFANSGSAAPSYGERTFNGVPGVSVNQTDTFTNSTNPQSIAAALSNSTANPEALTDAIDGLARATFADEGADFDPRPSADGKFLVYSSTQHRATADIYIKQIGSRSVTQLTADPASDIMPALSSDGSKIAFASDRSGAWKIYVMSAQGGQSVQMTFDGGSDLHPSWSPDGSRLVFCRLGSSSGRWEMWVLDAQQPAAAEFIGFGMFPEWCTVSATGVNASDKILFQRGRERGDRAFSLWTIDYAPGAVAAPTEVIASRGEAFINPTWSPDGKWIAFAAVPTNEVGATSTPAMGGKRAYAGMKGGAAVNTAAPTGRLCMASITGGGRVDLASGRFSSLMPAWGAGNRIYFVSNRGGADNIWSLSADKALAAAGASMNAPVAISGAHEAKPASPMHAEAKHDSPAEPAHATANESAAPTHAPSEPEHTTIPTP